MLTDSQKFATREVAKVLTGIPTSDGAGVKLTRMIGSAQLDTLDPFLLFDCFESDNPDDYIAGFPMHPHRGFETVTYLLAGRMRHKDSQGNEGVIAAGDVQWMTAARGISHSEMPELEKGLLKGFQLWINLPSKDKMVEPAYQEFSAASLPIERGSGYQAIVIAGVTNQGLQGPVLNPYTDPLLLDVCLQQAKSFRQNIAVDHAAFIYLIEGELSIAQKTIKQGQLAVLAEQTDSQSLVVNAGKDSRFLLVAAQSLNEPIARYGPFVMNTQQELEEAFRDYQQGKF